MSVSIRILRIITHERKTARGAPRRRRLEFQRKDRRDFFRVRELPADQRDIFLADACGENKSLREEVERMLDLAEKAGDFFDTGTGRGLDTSMAEALHLPKSEKPGDLIGPYILVRKLGEGGWGVVWEARQEKPIQRSVALKIIKAGMDTNEVLARFASERQALARMDHPGIARVFDAGITPGGRSYFIMELVDGIPLTKYCDEHRLSLNARLRLLMSVCDAVAHAHRKGVIHRDLKPSNILVGGSPDVPVVKVIDFGIAKATEGKLSDLTLFTRSEQIIGTPAYMSPEQAGNDPGNLDTRTDVYSLGILLYELLVGQTPLDAAMFRLLGNEDIRRAIQETDPPPPSMHLTSLQADRLAQIAAQRQTAIRELTKLASRELDWIAMKALEKSPDRRYASVDSLAADIERYLGGAPVEARPPSWSYRAEKFIRRHRRVLAFLILAVGAIVIAAGVAAWQALRARQPRVWSICGSHHLDSAQTLF